MVVEYTKTKKSCYSAIKLLVESLEVWFSFYEGAPSLLYRVPGPMKFYNTENWQLTTPEKNEI
jgi:hypothetical protein